MPVGLATNAELLWGDPMTVVVLECVLCLVLFYIYFSKRNKAQVALNDWRFTSAFILGCAMLNLIALTTLGSVNDISCVLICNYNGTTANKGLEDIQTFWIGGLGCSVMYYK
mmetsp:Transcript_11213/g.23670  ORF Transcript_11213/g.23670 Transcript_11213/m.23670 type:complete len:112 (+) Transcript_11213:518-853(+)